MLSSTFTFLVFAVTLSLSQFTIPVRDPNNITFSFGSCNEIDEDVRGKIFTQILKHQPDVWTWIGDAIYIESNKASHVEDLYARTLRSPGYTEFRAEIPIIGIWDDHDLGPDNGDKLYPYKERNRQYFLKFIGEPLASARWQLDGLYTSYYIGENHQVKIILIDMRYNKGIRMSFNSSEHMFDEKQWAWLEDQLADNDATFTLITSGVQVFPDDRLYPETWFTNSKERLFGLIRKTKRSGVILLSGDVHYAELMQYPCVNRVGYQLTEMTSSGLTHYLEAKVLIDAIYPDTYSSPNDRYLEKNYGIIRFLFDGDEPRAILEIRDKRGNQVLGKTITYSQVTFNETLIDLEGECAENVGKISRFFRHLFRRFAAGNAVAMAIVLVGLFLGLLIVFLWAALIFWRIDKRRGKNFKSKEERRNYMAMKYKYRSV